MSFRCVDHRDAGFEGLVSLLARFGLATEHVPRRDVAAREKPFHDGRQDVGLLRILSRGGTMVLLLRTTDGTGKTTTSGLRHDVDANKISSAIAAFAATTRADAKNYFESWDYGVADTAVARTRMERAFAEVAPFFREPLEKLLDGQHLRSIGISDDGGINQLPFEALPLPDPAAPRQLLGDKYDHEALLIVGDDGHAAQPVRLRSRAC